MKELMVIIETPKGSNHKYDFDPELKRFKLNKILPAGLVFPFDFGYSRTPMARTVTHWTSWSFRKSPRSRVRSWIAA